MKKVLIITYAFPPSNDVAIHRVLRFGKWLPKYGWEPVILTPKYTLSQRIDTDNLQFVDKYFKKVYRTSTGIENAISRIADKKNRNPVARFIRGYYINNLTPDTGILWKSSAVKKGLNIIENEGIDAIWATIGPLTSGLIGADLKKQTGVPLLIDYRDPWTLNPYKNLSGRKLEKHRRLELSMLTQADTVTTTSDYIRDGLIENNYVNSKDVIVITNGYDAELQYINESTETVNLDPAKIHITYTGGFYGDRQPYSFLDGLKLFLDEYPENKQKLQFNIVGNQDPKGRIREYCKQAGLDDVLKELGLVSYKIAMQYLQQSDILLLVNGTKEESKIFIPGKLFDYMATKKPILFIGEGQPAEIVKYVNAGYVSSHDSEDIKKTISKMTLQFKDSSGYNNNINEFKSDCLTQLFSQTLPGHH
jgi:glycosyltransferase involved in cell wall biosynthesis